MVSMPRTKYAGVQTGEMPASSKLIGAESNNNNNNEDAEMIARQMASRLSKRLGVAVFVSCSLEEGAPALVAMVQGGGVVADKGMVQQRAAALAEREIFRLLQGRLKT
jgi:hypothetical protein